MRRPILGLLLAASLLTGAALTGCSEELNGDTSCRDFLQAPPDEQNAAIARVADELGTQNALTPLGRPNIDYICSRNQDTTLRRAVESTG